MVSADIKIRDPEVSQLRQFWQLVYGYVPPILASATPICVNDRNGLVSVPSHLLADGVGGPGHLHPPAYTPPAGINPDLDHLPPLESGERWSCGPRPHSDHQAGREHLVAPLSLLRTNKVLLEVTSI
ncbi:hypothetical protein MTO96_029631 [Rhipicephalus appendiculatus]